MLHVVSHIQLATIQVTSALTVGQYNYQAFVHSNALFHFFISFIILYLITIASAGHD